MSTQQITRKDLIHPRIDYYAQQALYRMLTGADPGAAADAAGMFGAIRAGTLGGIYIVNQLVPAKRARRRGTWWWLVIPKGENAVVMLDPSELPIIAFRDEVKSLPAKLDPALRKAYYGLRGGQPTCPGGGSPATCPVPVGSSEPRCNLPPRPPGGESDGLAEVYAEVELELEAPARTPNPNLCFYENVSAAEVGLFRGQAARWALRINALKEPNTTTCRKVVGPTPYTSGMDILRAIDATFWCLDLAPVRQVHVFGHSYPQGLLGAVNDFRGLYRSDPVLYEGLPAVNRSMGGATVVDVQPAWLAEDVTFVLHGCNTAKGDDNFARALFERLASGLKSPRVYGHDVSVCAGQDGYWREYSRRSPTGSVIVTSIPVYVGNGGLCGKLPAR